MPSEFIWLARGDGQKWFVHLVYFDVVDLVYSHDVNVARSGAIIPAAQGDAPCSRGPWPPGLFADRSRNASHRRELCLARCAGAGT